MNPASFGTRGHGRSWLGCGETESGRIPKSASGVDILFPLAIFAALKSCRLVVKQRAEIVKPLALSRKRGWSCLSGHIHGENQWSASGVDKSEYRFPEYVSIRFLWVRSTDPRLSGNRTKDATGGLR